MLRVGLIVPSSNTTMEREFWDALHGFGSVHTGRVFLERVNVGELEAMEDEAVKEAVKLATAAVDVVVYGCTSGSFVKGGKQFLEIEKRLEKATGIPSVATSGAVVRALEHLHAKKISLITPYIREITEIEKKFLEVNGFETVSTYYASILENTKIGRVSDEQVLEWALASVSPRADAVFISCTNLSTFKTLKTIEQQTGKPTFSSNSATLWNVLTKLGWPIDIPQLGMLFTHR
ncbi:MAG: maleate cis-trans isomerase [Candidatus Caldarchaeum sp.]|nr:maleate cis-trans isomerase [Candidatus Caldarchaeum sp.]